MDELVPNGTAALPPSPSSSPDGPDLSPCQTNRLDERVFRQHLQNAPFQSGVRRRRWRLASVTWPHAVIVIRAADRPGAPAEYGFRFECSGYPQEPPMARPWDMEADAQLAAAGWPTGSLRIPMAFNPNWAGGQGLYLPCDRSAASNHPNWRTEHPHLIWSPTEDITQYLKVIHEYLNSSDYSGTRRA